MEDVHAYEVNLAWTYDRRGILSSPVLPKTIEVATPPGFANGENGIWSPEHLFIASLNSCLLTTFLAIADNSRVPFISFTCNGTGKVDKVNGKYLFTEVTLRPKVSIASAEQEARIRRILEMSEKACVISNSVNLKINLEPEIIVL